MRFFHLSDAIVSSMHPIACNNRQKTSLFHALNLNHENVKQQFLPQSLVIWEQNRTETPLPKPYKQLMCKYLKEMDQWKENAKM